MADAQLVKDFDATSRAQFVPDFGAAATPITVAGIDQSQSIDNVTLTQHNVLAVNAVNQAQSLDAVTLTQEHVLAINDLLQSIGLQNIDLTQAHILAINDLTQQQILDVMELSGFVIGGLNGTVVVYALLGGELRCFPILDGTITLH
jgi:hypothetical protein